MSLAIIDIIPQTFKAQVKWPNDIYLYGKKCAGVLIETQIQRDKIKTAFIGIGLNVNQESFPAEIEATSLKLAGGQNVELRGLLDKLLASLSFRLEQLKLPELLARVYRNRLIGVHSILKYQDESGVFWAQIHHVEEDGRLVLDVQGEHTFRYYRFKEVKLLGAQ